MIGAKIFAFGRLPEEHLTGLRHEAFGRESEWPKMLFFECSYEVLERRIMGRAKFTGRSDDNLESLKQRFDTFKAVTLPMVELFESHERQENGHDLRDR